tara:strand:+ start:372 stop:623 length:252 start_codon:yes stop_codon:yes gene_type:complete
MDKFKEATKISEYIAKNYNSLDIQKELYQLLILHHDYTEAKRLSIYYSAIVKEHILISELRSLIILLPASSITEMESSLQPLI